MRNMNIVINSKDILTPQEVESLRQIVNAFEIQVRREASSHKYNGLSNKQKEELCAELSNLQEIKRKLKLLKGTK
jgi:hypothetical protein